MKKLLLILLGFSMSYFVKAQETVKQKEVGLVFSNFDNFGFTFRIGSDKSLWRFNTLFISGNNFKETANSGLNKNSSTGFGIRIGKEYGKNIENNLKLRFGADLSFTYSQSKSETDDKTVNNYDILTEEITYRPGINLVLGLNYKLSDNFVMGAELLPSFSYTTGTSTDKYYYLNNGAEVKSDISGFSYGLSNTSALLSLVYRF